MGDRPEHEAPQDSAYPGHGAAHSERGDDGSVDVDPHQRGDLFVLGDGPHGPTGLGPLYDVPQDSHRHCGHDQNHEAGAGDLEGQDGTLLGQPLGKPRIALGGRPEEPQHQVLDKERHADRRDQRNQPWRVAKGPVGHPFHHHSGEGREEDGHQDDERQAQHEVLFPHPVGLELVRRDEAGHSPHHEDLAVGEVDEPQHAVDHRVTEGDQAVHRTLGEPGDQETLELVAGEAPGVRVPPTGKNVVGVDLLPDEGQHPDHDHRD